MKGFLDKWGCITNNYVNRFNQNWANFVDDSRISWLQKCKATYNLQILKLKIYTLLYSDVYPQYRFLINTDHIEFLL